MIQHTNNNPIGILGGTFNPIHHGHLRLALELYERLDLAKVLLIPSAHPPHRAQPSVSSQRRLEMVRAAIMGVEGLSVDDREVRRQAVSYTVDTLDSLREEYPHRPLCLILGMDAFLGLPSWHEWERLITLAHLLVVCRPDTPTKIPEKHLLQNFFNKYQTLSANNFKKQTAGMIWMEEIPALAISATQIRDLIATGKNPHYLLPPAALDIINTHHLYR
jgi:nicotinate-nucleotide adenylyltransferase